MGTGLLLQKCGSQLEKRMNKEGCANTMNSKSTIKMIYDHLQDKESKTLFVNRLLYFLTEDTVYMD